MKESCSLHLLLACMPLAWPAPPPDSLDDWERFQYKAIGEPNDGWLYYCTSSEHMETPSSHLLKVSASGPTPRT